MGAFTRRLLNISYMSGRCRSSLYPSEEMRCPQTSWLSTSRKKPCKWSALQLVDFKFQVYYLKMNLILISHIRIFNDTSICFRSWQRRWLAYVWAPQMSIIQQFTGTWDLPNQKGMFCDVNIGVEVFAAVQSESDVSLEWFGFPSGSRQYTN